MGGGGGKKGGSSTPKLPHYYMTIDYGACHGPIDSVNQIYVKEKPIWCGYLTEPAAIYVNQPEIFGGEEKEGGVFGTIECYFGTPDQKMSGILADKLGLTPDTAPGYRDIAHFVFRGAEGTESLPEDSSSKITTYLSRLLSMLTGVPAAPTKKGFHWIVNNPYLPAAWINLTRLPKSLSETYSMILADADADFDVDDPYASTWTIDPDEDPDTFDLTGWTVHTEPFDVQPYFPKPPLILNLVALGIDPAVIDSGGVSIGIGWSAATVGLTDGGAVLRMFMNSFNGKEEEWEGDVDSPYTFIGKNIGGAPENPSLLFHTVEDGGTGNGSLSMTLIPGTRFVSVVGSYAIWFLIFDVLSPNTRTGTLSAAKIVPKHCGIDGKLYWLPDANPAHMIFECLTNADWGMGAPGSTIHTASFMASAATLFAEKFGLSMPWIQQAEIEKMISEIIDHIQAALYLDPQDGLWHLDLIRDDYDVEELLTLDDTNSTSTNRQRKALGETINEIVISYKDAQNEEDKTVVFHDLGNIAAQGQLVSETRNYYGVRNDALANKLGARDIRSASYPLFSADVQANREIGGKLRPGSVVKFTCPEDGITEMVVRVLKVNYGAPGDRYVRLNVIEDIFGLAQTEYTSIQETEWSDPGVSPVEIETYFFDTPPLPLLLRSGVSTDDISDDNYPQTVVASYAYQAVAVSYDLMTYVTAPNGDVSLSVVATLPVTPSGLLADGFADELQTVIDNDQMAAIVHREIPEPGDFIQVGGEGAAGEIVMIDDYTEIAQPTPIPDDPVWTQEDTTAPTAHTQTGGKITIEHTGDMDKSESYFTLPPGTDFDYSFAIRATMASDSAVTVGIFVGDDSVDRNQIALALFYTGTIYRQLWDGLTFVSEAPRKTGVYVLPIVNAPICFRAVREGAALTFYYSLTGKEWTYLERFDNLEVFIDDAVEIGVFLNSNGVSGGVTSKLILDGMDEGLWDIATEWTLARGMFDTVPQEWPAGTRAWFLSDFIDTIDPTENAAGAEKSYKLLPRTSTGVLAESAAAEVDYTPYDRPYLPFRPADTEIDGYGHGDGDLHYRSDTGIPAEVVATWANRNRLTEDQLAVRWTDANETPEDGQTTTLRVFEHFSQTVVIEYAGLTGTSYAIDVDDLIDYRFYDIVFLSEREGFESLTNSVRGLDLERLGYGNNYDFDYNENDGS